MITIKKNIKESVSSIVYHATSIQNCLDILKTNKFELTTSLGTSADQHGEKFYYFSLSRIKHGGYLRSMLKGSAVNLVLDGSKFNQRYKGTPVDYWGRNWRRNVSKDQALKNDENEERIISDDPYIPNAVSYIKEIHICFSNENYEMEKDKEKIYETLVEHYNYRDIKKISMLALNEGIDVYLYYNPKHFVLHDKRKTIDPHTGYDLGYIKAIIKADQASTWSELQKIDDDKVYTIRNILSSYYDYKDMKYVYGFESFKKSLESEIHNIRKDNKNLISKLTNIMKKYRVRNFEELFIALAKKFEDSFKN
ncbi:MAG: hypothetical protein ACOC3V_00510 [bacterium]